jgi:5-methylcytosine-specific restriction endonuclease McrA
MARWEEFAGAYEAERVEREARLAKIRAKPSTDIKTKFYASVPWKRLRYKALAANAARNGGVACCELCGTTAAPGAPLNGDHIEPLSKAWDRRLDPTNVQVLCGDCNHGKSNRDAIDWRPADPEDDRPVDASGFGIHPQ